MNEIIDYHLSLLQSSSSLYLVNCFQNRWDSREPKRDWSINYFSQAGSRWFSEPETVLNKEESSSYLRWRDFLPLCRNGWRCAERRKMKKRDDPASNCGVNSKTMRRNGPIGAAHLHLRTGGSVGRIGPWIWTITAGNAVGSDYARTY